MGNHELRGGSRNVLGKVGHNEKISWAEVVYSYGKKDMHPGTL
jgi:hypothetical protein